MVPNFVYSHNRPEGFKRHVTEFTNAEIQIDVGIVNRIEFREKRCNLTLKNISPKRHTVNVRVFVLNRSFIELWRQTEKWSLTSLQPDQVHLVSWEFHPAVPDVVWHEKAREPDPMWVVVDVL